MIAIPAMVLGLVIWSNPEGAAPTAALISYFILLALWNGVLLRLGVSFLRFAWHGPSSARCPLAISWLMASW